MVHATSHFLKIYLLLLSVEDSGGTNSFKDKEVVRAEMGLEWMLRPEAKMDRGPRVAVENEPEVAKNEEVCSEFQIGKLFRDLGCCDISTYNGVVCHTVCKSHFIG